MPKSKTDLAEVTGGENLNKYTVWTKVLIKRKKLLQLVPGAEENHFSWYSVIEYVNHDNTEVS